MISNSSEDLALLKSRQTAATPSSSSGDDFTGRGYVPWLGDAPRHQPVGRYQPAVQDVDRTATHLAAGPTSATRCSLPGASPHPGLARGGSGRSKRTSSEDHPVHRLAGTRHRATHMRRDQAGRWREAGGIGGAAQVSRAGMAPLRHRHRDSRREKITGPLECRRQAPGALFVIVLRPECCCRRQKVRVKWRRPSAALRRNGLTGQGGPMALGADGAGPWARCAGIAWGAGWLTLVPDASFPGGSADRRNPRAAPHPGAAQAGRDRCRGLGSTEGARVALRRGGQGRRRAASRPMQHTAGRRADRPRRPDRCIRRWGGIANGVTATFGGGFNSWRGPHTICCAGCWCGRRLRQFLN